MNGSTPRFDRRRFLGVTGGLAAASVLGIGAAPSASARSAQPSHRGADGFGDPSGRTLVVVELEGGNDGLNTLVPSVGRYHDLRPSIGVTDDELLTFSGLEYGVNPAIGSLRSLWEADQLAAIYGVGLPGQSRSHFVAQDAWRSALPGAPATSGWLGRWLEETESDDDEVPLRAVALGRSTLAAQGMRARPVAVQSVDSYRLEPPKGNDAVTQAVLSMADARLPGLFGEVQESIPRAVDSVDLLQGLLAEAGASSSDIGPDPTSSLFAASQAIIQADVGTQVLYLTIGGFDTHAAQREVQDELLTGVADGVASLFDGLAETGHDDRTLVLMVTEFGRRVAENGSDGTDHGKGGLALMAGPAVTGSRVHGEVDLDNLVDGDLAITIDTRSVYDSALAWLGAPADLRGSLLDDDTESLDLLQPSALT